jgi:hypothetical protein
MDNIAPHLKRFQKGMEQVAEELYKTVSGLIEAAQKYV